MSRFILGLSLGGVGSFYVLQQITERRLVYFKKADKELIETGYYHRKLRRLIFEEHQQTKDEISEIFRLLNNKAISSIAGKETSVDSIKMDELLARLKKAILK